MKITQRLGTYIATNVDDPALMRAHGWNAFKDGSFRTSQTTVAAPFYAYADGAIQGKLRARFEEIEDEIYGSMALTSDFEVPLPPGEEARPYQRAGVEFLIDKPRALLADSMRLGKTLQAIGVGNVRGIKRSLIVPPATAKVNWQRALMRFKTFGGEVGVANGDDWPNTPHVVCNYDILDRHQERIEDTEWDLCAFDEAHKLRNFKAARTRFCLGDGRDQPGVIQAKQTFFITGTPIFTRPRDLWPIVRTCDPLGLGKKEKDFLIRYCGAEYDASGYLLGADGATNLIELQRIMRQRFMVRRDKKDVAGETAVQRETVVIPNDQYKALVRAEREANAGATSTVNNLFAAAQNGDDLSELFATLVRESFDDAVDEGMLSTIRKEIALLKVPTTVSLVEEILETPGEKVVIFAHHRDVVAKLKQSFPDAAVLVGGMTPKQKDAAEQRFQTDPECRVFIGNIEAAGQAIRLDAADHLVFCEISWSPGDMEQCEDRIWDVLKKAMLSIYRIVVEGTLDEQMSYVVDKRIKDNKQAMTYRGVE